VFGRRRLAREEYALMGRNPVWQLHDAVNLLTSFEMEQAGAFGETDELVEIKTLFSVIEPLSDIETAYDKVSTRWTELLHKALWDEEIPYANIPKNGEVEPVLPEGAGRTVTDTGSFARDELLLFLVRGVDAGDIELDLAVFRKYLLGQGNAPATDTLQEKDVVSRHMKDLAQRSHDNEKPKQEALRKFLKEDLSGGCTCTKLQAVERIFRDKYREDEAYLKAQTGFKKLMFSRQVSKALIQIEEEEKTGVNRHENTDGFNRLNVPPCLKHKP